MVLQKRSDLFTKAICCSPILGVSLFPDCPKLGYRRSLPILWRELGEGKRVKRNRLCLGARCHAHTGVAEVLRRKPVLIRPVSA